MRILWIPVRVCSLFLVFVGCQKSEDYPLGMGYWLRHSDGQRFIDSSLYGNVVPVEVTHVVYDNWHVIGERIVSDRWFYPELDDRLYGYGVFIIDKRSGVVTWNPSRADACLVSSDLWMKWEEEIGK